MKHDGWPQNDVKVLICSGTCDESSPGGRFFLEGEIKIRLCAATPHSFYVHNGCAKCNNLGQPRGNPYLTRYGLLSQRDIMLLQSKTVHSKTPYRKYKE